MADGGNERILSVAPSIVDPAPRTKPRPTRAGLGLEHVYAPSDDGVDENLLVVLHGLGDTMAPFVRMAKQFKLPQTATLVLQGPELIPFLDEGEEMYQWYTSFTSLGELIDHPNPLPGVRAVHRAIEHLTGPECGWPAKRVHLFGFAQGGSVALEAALRWDGGVGSAVSVCGGLVEIPTRQGPGAGTRVLYVGDEAGSAGLKRGFEDAQLENTVAREVRMPRGKDEWSVVMRFWSQVLERRGPEGEGIHRVMMVPVLAVLIDSLGLAAGVECTTTGSLSPSRFTELLPPSPPSSSPPSSVDVTLVVSTDTASGSSTATRSRASTPVKPQRIPSATTTQTPTPPASPPPEPRKRGLGAFNRRSLAVIDERTSHPPSPHPPPPKQLPALPPAPVKAYARIFARFRRHASADHVEVPTAAPASTTPANPVPVAARANTAPKRPQPVAGPSTVSIKPRKTLKKRGSQPIPNPAEPVPSPKTTRPSSPNPRRATSPVPVRSHSPAQIPAPAPIPLPSPVPVPLSQPPRRSRTRTGTFPSIPRSTPTEMHRPHGSQPAGQSLRSWWERFKQAQSGAHKKDPDDVGKHTHHTVFGIPLRESLRYASVQISTADPQGDLYVWGYIPVVVAKCGLFLKENATEAEGVFRINGSNRRMRDLQALFESPPRYGKDLNWKHESYTSHDVASVFRRYLTQMPEPVIPNELYHSFRGALSKQPRDESEIIHTYRRLIKDMPRANQYLLLYVLDLLSVFARKSDKNLMTESNLAVIFRPGIISHPTHEMQPQEHALSQEVLVFLIQHQDHFMLDPPARGDSIMVSAGTSAGFSPAASERPGFIVPSDSDEDAPVGGWKLVERRRGSENPVVRRRSLNDPGVAPVVTAEPETIQLAGSGTSSPVGGNKVKRSRTVPTQRGASAMGEAEVGKVSKRRGTRMGTLGSVGSTAEAGISGGTTEGKSVESEKERVGDGVKPRSKEREKTKEKEKEGDVPAPIAVDFAGKEKVA